MTDHANELRRHARKIPHPQGETPGVMLRAADEIECLRAKIERMEQQVPICRVEDLKHAESLLPTLGLKPENHLYALPGAQPALSVPDGWRLVPIVSTHEMKEAGACAGAVYYAIAKDVWSAMLAAAPEAKP